MQLLIYTGITSLNAVLRFTNLQ